MYWSPYYGLEQYQRIHNSKFWPIFPFKIAAFLKHIHTQYECCVEMYSYNHGEPHRTYHEKKREREREGRRFSTFANNSTIHFNTLLRILYSLTHSVCLYDRPIRFFTSFILLQGTVGLERVRRKFR